MKRILLVATGGTIASRPTATGLTPMITSREILEFVPETAEICQIDTRQIANIDSTNMNAAHWLDMVRTIQAEYEIPFGGALEYFGLSRTVTYSGTGEAVCVDILDYVNTVDTFKALTDQTFGSKALGAVNSILGTIRKIRDLFE